MDFAEHLKTSVDIVKVIGEYVRLRRVGATGRYSGLCPFHQEKTPSFSVNQSQQFFKCFGCGVGGDVYKFVMQIDGLTFPETLKLLAERNGIPIPQRPEYSDAESKMRGALLDMHELAARHFQANLRGAPGEEARSYLERRGVSQELIDTFAIGFADASGQAVLRLLSEKGFSVQQMEASGLVRKRTEGSGHYDNFRGRLIFPIHGENGKVIAFGGRAMRDDEQPKYLNSPETPIYKKTSVLYNLHRARDGMRKASRALLVEGYMDVIGVYAAGVREVVASCGTALTNVQVRAIHRHADTVIVNFDPDTAGANAAERAIQLLLDEGLHVKVVTLGAANSESKLDPDEYVKQFGADAYLARLENASGYFHWLADRARERFDMRSPEGKTDAFKFLLPAVQKLPDRLERAAVANDLASYLGVEASLVLDQFKRSATDRKNQPTPKTEAPSLPPTERMLLRALMVSAEAREDILPQLTAEILQSLLLRDIFGTLFQMVSAGTPISFSGVEDRLEPQVRVLLHQAIAADDMEDEAVLRDQAQACLRRLTLDAQKRELDVIRARVKEAERDGRLNEALEWMTRLSQMERDLRETV